MLENSFIRLVPAHPSLAGALADYYIRNREFLQPFEPVREEDFFTPEHQRSIIEGEVLAWEEKRGYRFYICPAGQSGTIIGSIGLNNVVWGAFRSAYLGYKLDKDYINKGYMTMAVDLVTGYAFRELGLHRIEGNVMPRNRCSLRVLEKCGYENEGLAKCYLNINGVWEDHVHMVRLNLAMHE